MRRQDPDRESGESRMGQKTPASPCGCHEFFSRKVYYDPPPLGAAVRLRLFLRAIAARQLALPMHN
jgi:hypothetical protein